MAGGQERALRRRIRSIQSTKKITRAMELIAATRVTAAQQRAAAARPYSERITAVIQNLAAVGGVIEHPLLRPPDPTDGTKVAFVAIASDRGLAGPYNANVIRATERELQARRAEGADYSLVLVGKKLESYFRFRGYRIDHAFSGMSDRPTYEDARQVAEVVRGAFEEGDVDGVVLVFTRFLSVASQRVVVRQFMPLTGVEVAAAEGPHADYEFEPAPDQILAQLLPRYVEARLYAAMLDAAASEHAARQRAMKAATDNAEELIVKYSRAMNRARQDAITTEIMEIVGGAEAMRAAQVDRSDLLPDHVLMSADILADRLDLS
ncbi:MAG TPA: F0F1 ATP synthase subunit gamma [Acidimicrobiales bacterium]